MKMLKKLYRILKEQKVKFVHRDNVPVTKKNDDIYIVEFPKSGITWLSTIIANVNLLNSNSKQQATFFNIQQLIPDIHMTRDVQDSPLWNVPKNRFIKSHAEWCPFYLHTIYIVRNPVSVMNSYYRFCIDRNIYEGTFSDFIRDKNFGVIKWKDHILSWKNAAMHQRMHILKFEDLRVDTFNVVKELYLNLGIAVSDEIVNKAINMSSLESMKAKEQLLKKYDLFRKEDFVKEGNLKASIQKNDRDYIISVTKDIIQELNYNIEDI